MLKKRKKKEFPVTNSQENLTFKSRFIFHILIWCSFPCFQFSEKLVTQTAAVSLCLHAVGRLEEALECALTYLLFHEGEEFVTENVEYYREELGHSGKPREVRN